MKKKKKVVKIPSPKMVKIKPLSPQLTARLQTAMNAQMAGNNPQAIMIAEEITKAAPDHPDAYHL